jgi:ABC-2 type transport system ATP-binding protein
MLGFMTQETVVDSYLTARQNLEIFARLYHIPPERVDEKVNHALKEANLTDFGDVASGTFSGGMQRRLNLVKSMIQEPKILILDEPTTGLDIQSRVVMWAEIRRLNKLGITIILTTQYLEEADNLCDTIAVIDHGLVKAIGTASELKKIVAKGNILGITVEEENIAKVAKMLKSKFGLDVIDNNGRLEAPITENSLQQLIKIAQELQKEKIEVLTISMHLPTMDDVFIKLTGASIRDTTSSDNAQAQKNFAKVGFGGRR